MKLCKICGRKADGNHFGVLSCRACAAFFRRYSRNFKRHQSVNKVHQHLQHQNEIFDCKICRLKKCLEHGMDASKIQSGRDLNSSTQFPRHIPKSVENSIGRPNFLYFCDPDGTEHFSTIKTIVNFDFLIAKSSQTLRNGSGKPYSPELSSLEKLSLFLESSTFTMSSAPKYLNYLEKGHFMLCWEHEFLKTVEWLTHFDELNQIALNVRVSILTNVWTVFGRFDKLAKTAEFRRKRLLTSGNMFMVGDNEFIDVEETNIDVSWFSDYSKDQILYLMHSYHNENFNTIVDKLIELNPSAVEFTFMLLEVCLQQAEKRIPEVTEVTDRLQEVVSNQLHSYYQKTRNINNYAGRISKMMQVNNLMRKDLREKTEKKKIADVFHVFTLDFSHPEMLV